MPDPVSLVGPARDRAARGDPAVHDHLCGIYESRDEQYEAASRFLKVGLQRNQRCLYISEKQTPEAFTALLETQGIDTKSAVEKGALQVMSGEEVRRLLGGFTPDSMMSFLTEAEEKSLAAGFAAFRWGAEMTWLRNDGITPAELFLFEASLNDLLAKHELTGFCQYAREDFNSELLIAAAETHPLLVYNSVVCDNFYYIPPEDYLKPRFSDAKLTRMLFNIITRERLMQEVLS